MKTRITLTIILTIVLCQLAGQLKAQKIIEGDFSHTVLIWLKNPESQEDRAKIEAGMKKLIADSKYIKSAHLGTPAGTDRPIVDNSYTYCLIVTFEDRAAQDKYQVETAHKTFLAECAHLWSKGLIYDSINLLE